MKSVYHKIDYTINMITEGIDARIDSLSFDDFEILMYDQEAFLSEGMDEAPAFSRVWAALCTYLNGSES